MNIIEHLTRTVTPIVLSGKSDTNNNYTSLLEKVYAIIVARLADKDTYHGLADVNVANDDQTFFERLLPNSEQHDKIITELAKEHEVSETETKSLIARSAPLVLNELKGLAGTSSIPNFLSNHLSSLTALIPTWAYAFIPAGILSILHLNVGDALKSAGESVKNIAGNVADTAGNVVGNVADKASDVAGSVVDKASDVAGSVAGVAGNVADKASDVASNVTSNITSTVNNVTNNEEGGGLMKTLLPIIGLLILAALAWALLKSCNKNPAPVATPPAITASAPASTASGTAGTSLLAPTLKFSTDADGKLATGGLGNVGNDDLKTKILGALSGVFGTDADKAVNVAVNPAYDINLPFADKLPEIFALLKGVPNATLNFADGHIMVSAPDETTAKKLVADIQALVPNVPVMLESEHGHGHGHSHDHSHASTTTPASVASPTSATETKVISNSEPSVFFENGHLKFYFATGKADVAPNALDHAKEILEAAKQGKKLGISGYTDSTGNAQANAELSKKRAKAVQQFLIANGVPEAQLELIKPKDTVGATGKDQEGRRVEVYIVDSVTTTASTPASASN